MSLANLTKHFHVVVARNKILEGEHRHMRNQLTQSRARELTLQNKLTGLMEQRTRLVRQRDDALRERWEATPCQCMWEGWLNADGTGGSKLLAKCPRCSELERLKASQQVSEP